MAQSFNGFVIEVGVADFNVAIAEGVGVYCEAVVLRSDFDFAGFVVHHGLVTTAVSKLEFVGGTAQGMGQHLVPQTYPEKWNLFLDQTLDGRVKVVFGTHTHVPTADGRILRGGSAYQSDLGMTGPRESVLGRDIDACLGRFKDGMPRKCPVAEVDVGMQGCIIEINPDTGLANSHQIINWRESDLPG